MARIGVAPSLTSVKDALMEMGHEVVDLQTEEDASNCEFAVISGQDKDMMGISEVFTQGSVINADGTSAQEVCNMLDEKIQ